jgi:O-6-methylguanine DNA methyltransferase
MAGNPRATRAVANACKNNPCPIVVPCHRVIRRDRGLGGYYWGVDMKRKLLERENIYISPAGNVL